MFRDDAGHSRLRFTSLIACLIAAAALLGGCGKSKQEAAENEVATPVQVATVTRDSIRHIVTADAILYPINQANVTSKISAPLHRVLVNRGDHVQSGQLLVELENRDLAAAAQESKGQYEQAQAAYQTTTGATVPEDKTKATADLQAAQQGLETAKKVYENRAALWREGALAQKLVDDAKVAMVQAQSQYDTALRHLESVQKVSGREQVRSSQAQLEAAKAHYENLAVQLSYAEIRSPINGVVADRPLYPGEMAASGSAIVSIVDISQVVARANAPVKEAAAIKVGRPATLSGPGGNLEGKVTVVSPAVDPSTTTVQVWVQATNTGERFKPGATVRVAINAETIKNAVVVPAAALLSSDDGGEKVMVVGNDSLAHERKVEVGVRETEKVQITSGVKEGEQVVTSGGLGLEDKAKVTVQKPGANEKESDDRGGEEKSKTEKK